MSAHPPRIRVHSTEGVLVMRESLSIHFYMRHSHEEVARAVMHALEAYSQAIAPNVLELYVDEDGSWQNLSPRSWIALQETILTRGKAHLQLASTGSPDWYHFSYRGRRLAAPAFGDDRQNKVSAVAFWLPTEFLEERGHESVRALVLELAKHLPFCSGHAGLSFDCEMGLVGIRQEVFSRCFRYPGLDIPDQDGISLQIGTRLRGPSWLTFLGQPVLGELGGVAGLRARLPTPGTTVQELEGDRAVITLGPWPEAGDTQQGQTLPAYRELARVLEPWLYFEQPRGHHEPSEEVRRWERRFLD